MNAYIEAISTYLPKRILTNDDLACEYPDWNMEQVVNRSGVYSRHIANADETSFNLSQSAVDKLFSHDRHEVGKVDAIIFCTQTPDYMMPSNSHLLHSYLRLPSAVLAFDINLACSGFIYGLSIADAFIKSGQAKKVLLVTSETYSKLIHPGNRSVRTLFGDGCAATLISGDDEVIGFNKFNLSTYGDGFDKFYIPAGGFRNPKNSLSAMEKVDSSANVNSDDCICMDGMAVWAFINSTVPPQIRSHIAEVGWSMDQIDMFFFHQGSKMTLDSLARALILPEKKTFSNLMSVGNTVSASIPICIRDYLIKCNEGLKDLQLGSKICLSGFGVGLSYGTTTYKYEKICYAY
jgi:3-oxoacyl-[acyl-carrier-protein] synthase-3